MLNTQERMEEQKKYAFKPLFHLIRGFFPAKTLKQKYNM